MTIEERVLAFVINHQEGGFLSIRGDILDRLEDMVRAAVDEDREAHTWAKCLKCGRTKGAVDICVCGTVSRR